jgi:hypothetical protein
VNRIVLSKNAKINNNYMAFVVLQEKQTNVRRSKGGSVLPSEYIVFMRRRISMLGGNCAGDAGCHKQHAGVKSL